MRGFRVEPGEIEAALAAHPAVRECAVAAHADARGKRLVAYVVGTHDDVSDLRGFLKQRLPDWMVPSAFVRLDALPLTRTGKLDRRALPAPDLDQEPGTAYVAPRTPDEESLAAVWADVLGRERVGVHDNFFELGGDSILSIQVIARAREAGIHLTPRQMFRFQTVAEQVAAAGHTAVVAEQGTVSGPVPLTPIQRWFFDQELPEPHHANMSVLLEIDAGHDQARIEEALQALVAHHDALRLRYRRDAGEEWEQENAPSEPSALCQRIAGDRAAGALQASLDLESGPLLRAGLIERPGDSTSRLLLVVHHLAMDGVSWRILLADLATALDQLERGEPVRLPAKTTSFKAWAETLAERALSPEVAAEADHWEAQLVDSMTVPVDRTGENRERSARRVAVELGTAETRALLETCQGAGRARVPELLLAAAAEALARWTGRRSVVIDVEGHGRVPISDDIDLSRTVGWFTAQYPVRLELPASGSTVAAVARALREVPGSGLGFGLLCAARPEWKPPAPDVVFNYLGQFDLAAGAGAVRLLSGERGAERGPRNTRAHLLDIDAAVVDGRATIAWIYSEEIHRAETIERVAGWFREALAELVARAPDRVEEVPARSSDGPVAIPRGGPLPLSFMQERFWFLDQFEPGAALFSTPTAVRLRGRLDRERLRASLAALVARHEALRSSFPGPDGVPVAVIAPALEVELPVSDLGRLPAGERQAAAEAEVQAEASRSFDLATGPLVRWRLLRLSDEDHVLVAAVHHIVSDGWSSAILLRELVHLYAGRPLSPLPIQYADHAAWEREQLSGERLTRLLDYWRGELAGAPPTTELPADRDRPPIQTYRGERLRHRLQPELWARLRALGRSRGATPFMLLLAGFDALVARWSGQTDLVVGMPVSGRSRREVEGVVGPFLKTVALRVSLDGDPSFASWSPACGAPPSRCISTRTCRSRRCWRSSSRPRSVANAGLPAPLQHAQLPGWHRVDRGARVRAVRRSGGAVQVRSHGLRRRDRRRGGARAGLQRRSVRPRADRGAGRAVPAPPGRMRR